MASLAEETYNAVIADEASNVEEVLITSKVTNASAKITRRHMLGVIVAVMGLAAVCAIAILGKLGSNGQHVEKEVLGLSALPSYVALQTCYGYTGGNCIIGDCDVHRGAMCMEGKCNCVSACAGPDLVCHKDIQNEPIKLDFMLRSYHQPQYRMHFQSKMIIGEMSAVDQVKIAIPETIDHGDGLFNLYKLPGSSSTDSARFFLGSAAWPNSVAHVDTSASINEYGLYAVDLRDAFSPLAIATSVCYDATKNALMIGDGTGKYWTSTKHGTDFVYANASKISAGDEGYWIPSPALLQNEIEKLPPC